jgi:hypothetical protein
MSVPELQVYAARLRALEERLQASLDAVEALQAVHGATAPVDKAELDRVIGAALSTPHGEPDLSWSSAVFPRDSFPSTVFPPAVEDPRRMDHASRAAEFAAARGVAEASILETGRRRQEAASETLLAFLEEEVGERDDADVR